MYQETEEKVDLMAMLKDSNEVLRSAFSIASRRGEETNWEAFTKRVEKILDKQHLIIYPKREGGPSVQADSLPTYECKECFGAGGFHSDNCSHNPASR